MPNRTKIIRISFAIAPSKRAALLERGQVALAKLGGRTVGAWTRIAGGAASLDSSSRSFHETVALPALSMSNWETAADFSALHLVKQRDREFPVAGGLLAMDP